MTSAQYQGRYQNLPVYLEDGTIARVKINQCSQHPTHMNFEARGVFLRTLANNGIARELTVETSTAVVKVVVQKPPEPDNRAVRRPYCAELTSILIQQLRDGQTDPGSDAEKAFVDFALLARYAFAGKVHPKRAKLCCNWPTGGDC